MESKLQMSIVWGASREKKERKKERKKDTGIIFSGLD